MDQLFDPYLIQNPPEFLTLYVEGNSFGAPVNVHASSVFSLSFRALTWTENQRKPKETNPYMDGLKNDHIYKRADNKWSQVSINHYILAVVWIAKTSVFWRMRRHEVDCSYVQGSPDPESGAWSPVRTGLLLCGDLVLLRNHPPNLCLLTTPEIRWQITRGVPVRNLTVAYTGLYHMS